MRIWPVTKFQSWRRETKRRTGVRQEAQSRVGILKQNFSNALENLKRLKGNIRLRTSYPSVIQKELARLEARADAIRGRIEKVKNEASGLPSKDPDAALAYIEKALSDVQEFHTEIENLKRKTNTMH